MHHRELQIQCEKKLVLTKELHIRKESELLASLKLHYSHSSHGNGELLPLILQDVLGESVSPLDNAADVEKRTRKRKKVDKIVASTQPIPKIRGKKRRAINKVVSSHVQVFFIVMIANASNDCLRVDAAILQIS